MRAHVLVSPYFQSHVLLVWNRACDRLTVW